MSQKKALSPLPIIPEQPAVVPGITKETGEGIIPAPTFKQSGHYIDAKLKHSYGRDSTQISLWDALLPETKEGNILRFEPYKEEKIVEGIRLTTREDNTISAVMRVLKRKSEPGAYMGNLPAEIVDYGGREQKAPKLGVSLHEIAVETYQENYSGRELELLVETLTGLSERRFLISYRRLRADQKYDIIEEYQPLIKLYGVYQGVSEKDATSKAYRKKGEFALALNPVFVDQIDTKFIEFPVDIDRRTMIAAEALNNRYPEAVNRLRDYLIRAIQAGSTDTTEMNEDKLPYQLGLEKYIHEGRRKLIKQNTEKAFKAVTALGLVTKIDRIKGAEGQWKYAFHLNRDWH